jgi:hypothetical protein
MPTPACNVIEQRKGDAVQQLNTALSQNRPSSTGSQIARVDHKISIKTQIRSLKIPSSKFNSNGLFNASQSMQNQTDDVCESYGLHLKLPVCDPQGPKVSVCSTSSSSVHTFLDLL